MTREDLLYGLRSTELQRSQRVREKMKAFHTYSLHHHGCNTHRQTLSRDILCHCKSQRILTDKTACSGGIGTYESKY